MWYLWMVGKIARRVSMDILIIYEDNHLLVVEKPVNIPVQADNTNDLDLLNILNLTIK